MDGHDIRQLYKTLQEAKRVNHAVLVHVRTKKGKGYVPAEEEPSRFHGVGPFDAQTGETKGSKGKDSYTCLLYTSQSLRHAPYSDLYVYQ